MQQEQSKEEELKEEMKAFGMLVIKEANSLTVLLTVVNERDNDVSILKKLKKILKTSKSRSVCVILVTTEKLKSLNISTSAKTTRIKLTDKEIPCKNMLAKIISTKKQSSNSVNQSGS